MMRYAAKELLVRPFATLIVPFRADETLRHPALGLLSGAFVVLVLTFGAGRSGWRDHGAARGAAATSAFQARSGVVNSGPEEYTFVGRGVAETGTGASAGADTLRT